MAIDFQPQLARNSGASAKFLVEMVAKPVAHSLASQEHDRYKSRSHRAVALGSIDEATMNGPAANHRSRAVRPS
ncbi:hypothetical protein N8E89_22690 (plasmid) [Phyllobacterium sp. A18/5-2]|uniref:hypothetical protein n=1 Tax=Phyllobacterium sp. A18/5-2 TaxID=2978392 RepID=UPI0021C85DE3|nr:hypothetical protein [Phyllobacterium sp. A18/5-2]UXN66042.1 hypothetical protein N8E89_22690 [Phyllobacterium sp. A18/5-2]